MNIGIYDLNECSSLNYKDRLSIYRDCGFTSVGLYLDDKYMANGENYVEIINEARRIGLKVNQVHVDYKISNLICDDNSDEYFIYVEEKLEECVKLKIPYMVLHASKGEDAPRLTELAIKRLKELMSKYSDREVCLCFENVRDNRNLDEIMNLDINNMGMCYDMGHAYCYSDVYELAEKYFDKIKCSHLHNNYKSDTHNTLFDGEIDSKSVISKLNKNIDNCLEVFPKRGDHLSEEQFVEFVKNNYSDYCKCALK